LAVAVVDLAVGSGPELCPDLVFDLYLARASRQRSAHTAPQFLEIAYTSPLVSSFVSFFREREGKQEKSDAQREGGACVWPIAAQRGYQLWPVRFAIATVRERRWRRAARLDSVVDRRSVNTIYNQFVRTRSRVLMMRSPVMVTRRFHRHRRAWSGTFHRASEQYRGNQDRQNRKPHQSLLSHRHPWPCLIRRAADFPRSASIVEL